MIPLTPKYLILFNKIVYWLSNVFHFKVFKMETEGNYVHHEKKKKSNIFTSKKNKYFGNLWFKFFMVFKEKQSRSSVLPDFLHLSNHYKYVTYLTCKVIHYCVIEFMSPNLK